jgi:Planctomycete cytochrome C/WD domain, G-beta repeat
MNRLQSFSNIILGFTFAMAVLRPTSFLAIAAELEFHRDVQPILTKYCVGCHNAKEAEGEFACDSIERLMKGSKKHVVVKAKEVDDSLLVRLIEGKAEPKMPPEDEAQLSLAEIKTVRAWIEQGAIVEHSAIPLRERLKVNSVASKHPTTAPITAVLILDDEKTMVIGRYNEITFEDLTTNQVSHRITDVIGKVTSLRWSSDHTKIAVASGVAGVGGQVSIIDIASKTIEKQFEGHRDTLYSAVLSPDGTMVASAGYDRKITLWDTKSGEAIRHFDGHNGAIYDLDFDSSGKLLVSCSADETSKVWHVSSGRRLDTLSQGEAEQYSVRFTADGKRVIAAGADRRVRVWKLISKEREAINPMLYSLFAHEKAVLWFRLSPDGRYFATAGEDRTVKLWSSVDCRPVAELGMARDIPSDAVWRADQQELQVATLAGNVDRFDIGAHIQEFERLELARRKNPIAVRDDLDSPEDESEPSDDQLATTIKADEVEPNNNFQSAVEIELPALISGTISKSSSSGLSIAATDSSKAKLAATTKRMATLLPDEDWFAFEAKAGDPWLMTATAMIDKAAMARKKKAATEDPGKEVDSETMTGKLTFDPKIEIRRIDGSTIVRTRLQAVRESYFTFRGKSSLVSDDYRLHRWEDMEINEYLYSGGEVVKLWLYPRGPDSGFKVYPGEGNRYTYFDTTPIAHAMGEPAWIVRELARNEAPTPNGLPVFPIYFENDDDPTRKEGKDSRLLFTAPEDGKYLVRIRDARGLEASDFKYQLAIRPPKLDFQLNVAQTEKSVTPGAGTEFTISAVRLDGFSGEIRITVDGIPDGAIVSKPLTIEAEQMKAFGTVFIPEGLSDFPTEFSIDVRGVATIGETKVVRKAKTPLSLKVAVQDVVKTRFVAKDEVNAEEISELVIHAGETISTFIAIERGKADDDVPYGKDDSGRNLPHGIFVDNIGLSGLVIKPGQNTREVFITAAPWLQPQVRPFHLKTSLKGNPTTKPIMLRVESR